MPCKTFNTIDLILHMMGCADHNSRLEVESAKLRSVDIMSELLTYF